MHHHLGPSWFPLGFLFVASFFFFLISGPFIYLLSIYFLTTLQNFLSSTQNPSSPTRDQACTPCTGMQGLNHWTAGEVLEPFNLEMYADSY